AMGGRVLTALNIVAWPAELDVDLLGEVMLGGHEKVVEAGGILCGGHSIASPTILYGLSVTGEVHPAAAWLNSGAREGDRLLLTKPLGIGIVSTAMKKDRVDAATALLAMEQMAALNRGAVECLADIEVHGATDVTGFGLMGHGAEMADGAGLTLELRAADIPLFPGALDLAREGFLSGGARRGREAMAGRVAAGGGLDEV